MRVAQAFLRKKHGNLIRGWRQALSQTDSMVPSRDLSDGCAPRRAVSSTRACREVLSKLHFMKAPKRSCFLWPNSLLLEASFLQAAARLGFAKESRDLWKSLDKDDSRSASIDELDPRSAESLAHFKAGKVQYLAIAPLCSSQEKGRLERSAGLGQLSVRGGPGSLQSHRFGPHALHHLCGVHRGSSTIRVSASDEAAVQPSGQGRQ